MGLDNKQIVIRVNWIITPEGDPINLDYVTKIRKDLVNFRVIIHHGVTGGTGYSGSTQAYQYADAVAAQAAYDVLVQAILDLGIVKDLR
jgi:predicted alpha/beta-fold hydrolase